MPERLPYGCSTRFQFSSSCAPEGRVAPRFGTCSSAGVRVESFVCVRSPFPCYIRTATMCLCMYVCMHLKPPSILAPFCIHKKKNAPISIDRFIDRSTNRSMLLPNRSHPARSACIRDERSALDPLLYDNSRHFSLEPSALNNLGNGTAPASAAQTRMR